MVTVPSTYVKTRIAGAVVVSTGNSRLKGGGDETDVLFGMNLGTTTTTKKRTLHLLKSLTRGRTGRCARTAHQ
jgi:hypothetical protein